MDFIGIDIRIYAKSEFRQFFKKTFSTEYTVLFCAKFLPDPQKIIYNLTSI